MDVLSELPRLVGLWASGSTEAIREIASLTPELAPLGPRLHDELYDDPLAMRYRTQPPKRNEKPWHAIGCQRWAAQTVILAGYGDGTAFTLSPDLLHWGHSEPLPAPVVGLMLAVAVPIHSGGRTGCF